MTTATLATESGSPRLVRWLLGAVSAFVALNAFGGAWYGLAGARDVPREWLAGSPFDSYVVPSLFLGAVVGGACLAAAIALFTDSRFAPQLAMSAGVVLLLWIAAQVSFIGWVSWLQPAMAVTGALMVLLAAPLVPPRR